VSGGAFPRRSLVRSYNSVTMCRRLQRSGHFPGPGRRAATFHFGVKGLHVGGTQLRQPDGAQQVFDVQRGKLLVPLERRRSDLILRRVFQPPGQIIRLRFASSVRQHSRGRGCLELPQLLLNLALAPAIRQRDFSAGRPRDSRGRRCPPNGYQLYGRISIPRPNPIAYVPSCCLFRCRRFWLFHSSRKPTVLRFRRHR
jgi:hypothetical protein